MNVACKLRELYWCQDMDRRALLAEVAGEAAEEIERLWSALSWIADHDPQIVDAAREKFNLNT